MKKVGLVGGIGPESTISYYHDIVYGVQKRVGRDFFPDMSIESIDLFKWVELCDQKRYDELVDFTLAPIQRLAASGADFLCYVTPAEHLRLPDLNDVREGIIAAKIAAHAGDIAKGLPGAREIDNRMSDARRRLDWEEMFGLALDGKKAREYFESALPADQHSCSMCGKMCAMRTTNRILGGEDVTLTK